METKIEKEIKALEKFKAQKQVWIKLSFFVVIGLLVLYFDWEHVKLYNLERYVGFAGLCLGVVWWYWTMGLITRLLNIKKAEAEILLDIVNNIHEIKKDIKTD